MPLLQRANFTGSAPQRDDCITSGRSGRKRGRVGYPVLQRRAPNGVIILLGKLSERRIDQQLDLTGEKKVHRIGAALVHLEDTLGRDSPGPEIPCRSLGREDPEAEGMKPPS